MSVDLPLLSINKSILIIKTLVGLSLWLPISSLKRNPRRGLRVELMFNKNIIKLGDNIEYIKEAVDAVVIL